MRVFTVFLLRLWNVPPFSTFLPKQNGLVSWASRSPSLFLAITPNYDVFFRILQSVPNFVTASWLWRISLGLQPSRNRNLFWMKNRTIWAKLANSNKPYDVKIVLCNCILNLIVTFYSPTTRTDDISKTLINYPAP